MSSKDGRTFLGYVMCGDFTPDEGDALWPSADIAEEAVYERRRQLLKWGDQTHRTQHEYLAILLEEVGEVAKAINEVTYSNQEGELYISQLENLREELIQVAAVAIGQVEALDRLTGRPKDKTLR